MPNPSRCFAPKRNIAFCASVLKTFVFLADPLMLLARCLICGACFQGISNSRRCDASCSHPRDMPPSIWAMPLIPNLNFCIFAEPVSFTYLRTHLLTYLPTYLLVYLLTYILTYLSTYLLVYFTGYLLTYLLTCLPPKQLRPRRPRPRWASPRRPRPWWSC